ncbi:hypothetical protein BGZ70_001520 [Mortierella alpina]|uniref:Uncharacterized protein n=1 Tax=Mortierella alpina TaxID=64518 RepID=A0A9P6IXK3_MORAP|nr:hypothetical protein BGZ70_001520 [Mortierella alpina]
MSEHHSRRRYDRVDAGVGYGASGYYGDESLPSSSTRARRAEGTTGIYDEKSFHAAKAGVGGPRLLPTGSTASLGRDAGGSGDRYSQYNNGRYGTTGRRAGGGGGEGGYYPPFAPGAPGMLEAMPGDHRDSRTQSVVLDSRQLERERELDLQQQARMLSMADAENQLRPVSGAVLKNQPGGSYNQHSQYSQKQPPMQQQYYYDDGYGNYGEYEGEYNGHYGEYDDGYYNAQWGPGPQDTAYGMDSNSQQPQNPYGSQNPYPKAEGYTQQQQQQQYQQPSPRKSRDSDTAAGQDEGQASPERGPKVAAMSNASAVSGSESMVHSPTTAGTSSPVDEVMPSMGTDFVPSRQELLKKQLHQQQLYQQQQQQVYNISGQIDGGEDAEGKEEYRLSVHGDGNSKKSSVNHDGGKEEYRLSQHDNGYQVPGTPTPAAAAVAADVMATSEAAVGATPPPLPILTKPKKSLQSMRG